MGLFNFRKNKIPLTDREGKTIYVKPEDKDKYVLTYRGWLLKDKVYTCHSNRIDPEKGLVKCVYKKTGWQIHLEELESDKVLDRSWEEHGRPWLQEHDPEWLKEFEKEHGQVFCRD